MTGEKSKIKPLPKRKPLGHNFAWALEQLKQGKNVCRQVWNSDEYLKNTLGVPEICLLYGSVEYQLSMALDIDDYEGQDWRIYE